MILPNGLVATIVKVQPKTAKQVILGFLILFYCVLRPFLTVHSMFDRYINGTRLDDRIVRTDWDAGFKEGRQYGRGKSGGQVRDEYRTDYDEGRGGYGKLVQTKIRRRDV